MFGPLHNDLFYKCTLNNFQEVVVSRVGFQKKVVCGSALVILGKCLQHNTSTTAHLFTNSPNHPWSCTKSHMGLGMGFDIRLLLIIEYPSCTCIEIHLRPLSSTTISRYRYNDCNCEFTNDIDIALWTVVMHIDGNFCVSYRYIVGNRVLWIS